MRPLLIASTVLMGVLTAAAPLATAQTPGPASGAAAPRAGIGASNLPLDISSDNSEQFQQERRAVWWGNVEAVQGTSRLRTPRLTAFFAPRDPNAPKPPPGAADAGVGQVERVEAEGPVYYVTLTQKATGDHATYLAADDTITLTGNVVLVQDRDVATGDKLVIQQKTGHSTLTSNAAKAGATPGSGRVRAVLYPSQSQAAPGAPAKPPGRRP